MTTITTMMTTIMMTMTTMATTMMQNGEWRMEDRGGGRIEDG